jgi:hypothetical protein
VSIADFGANKNGRPAVISDTFPGGLHSFITNAMISPQALHISEFRVMNHLLQLISVYELCTDTARRNLE